MYPYTDYCRKCDQLLAALGEALLRAREIEGVLWQHDSASGRPMDDYLSAEGACKRLRATLEGHLSWHDQMVAASDAGAVEHAAM